MYSCILKNFDSWTLCISAFPHSDKNNALIVTLLLLLLLIIVVVVVIVVVLCTLGTLFWNVMEDKYQHIYDDTIYPLDLIWEVVCWIRSDGQYRERDFSWFSSLSPGELQKCRPILKSTPTASCKILTNRPFSSSSCPVWYRLHNFETAYFWWRTSQRQSPDHVPVLRLTTKES
jgi:hypothetical protein